MGSRIRIPQQNSDVASLDPNPRAITMISVIAQERLLGAALVGFLSVLIVFERRKTIYASISQNKSKQPAAPRFQVVRGSPINHLWNKAVDQTFGPVIASLSAHGW